MKTFLNWFWNFVFCLKFHLQQFPPNKNFKNFPFFLFFFPLDFEKFQSRVDFIEFKNLVPPPFTKGGGSRYVISSVVLLSKFQIYNQSKVTPLKDIGWKYELNWIKFWPWCRKQLDILKRKQILFSMKQLGV